VSVLFSLSIVAYLHLLIEAKSSQCIPSLKQIGKAFGYEDGIEGVEWPLRKLFDEFDYGYVLTVHKAQGSQWDDVVLFDESAAFTESRQRWLYTGVTRAAKRLTLVV
jgi:hypothetical protein